ncbi:MAG: hypothetical protein K2M69_03860 [Muribaculaceae bacterium]|nr:hypothetical protein [Muribaculaceae bacterium]
MKSNLFLSGLISLFLIIMTGCDLDGPNYNKITVCPMGNSQSDSIEDEQFERIDSLPDGNILVYNDCGIMYEGDIKLNIEQWGNLKDSGNIFGEGVTEPHIDRTLNPVTNLPMKENRGLGVYPNGYNLWAMVRFVYDENLQLLHKERIKAALLAIQRNTNVRFYNATGLPTFDSTYGPIPYIRFKNIGKAYSSYSSVGKLGGEQIIGLCEEAFLTENIYKIEHEICHALGMMHEHCRNDRDPYVLIDTNNLTEKGKAQFVKQTAQYFTRGDYDYNSIMGYDTWLSDPELAIDPSRPVYTKRDGQPIYQGRELSDLDRKWLNYFYLPYVARSDTYLELDSRVYDGNNKLISESERLKLQAQLNNGKATPPADGHISNEF